MRRNSHRKKLSEKNGQNFPLNHMKKSYNSRSLGVRRGQRRVPGNSRSSAWSSSLHYRKSYCSWQSEAHVANGPEKKKKTTCACEKGPVRGQEKRPLPVQKGPGRSASEGPCDPLAHKQAVKNPEKEGTNPPRSRRSPDPHSGQGLGRSPGPTSVRSPTRA